MADLRTLQADRTLVNRTLRVDQSWVARTLAARTLRGLVVDQTLAGLRSLPGDRNHPHTHARRDL